MNNKNKLLFDQLKKIISNNEIINDSIIQKVVSTNDEILVKQNKCKVCNKKYNSNNRLYGSTCIKNLYSSAKITNSKEINDRELFLYSAIILRLGKINLSKQESNYVCESYLSKLYFKKLKYPKIKIIESKLNKCIDDNSKPIMKLNTAYRLTNILNRNKKKLSKEELDKVIDENILNFFRTYFTIAKINDKFNYEVYYYMQLLFWEIVVLGGMLLNYKLASKCLENALCVIGEKSKDLYITESEKDIISEIKEGDFKLKIQKLVKKYAVNGEVIFDENSSNYKKYNSYKFKNGDLSYALHNVKFFFKGTKKDNIWNLKINITDRYDFTEILSNDYFTKNSNISLNLGALLNDMAAISTQYGVLQEYNIKIDFDWNITIE